MELWEEQFFMDALKLEKLYRSCVREAADGYGLTPNEVAVLLFLSRHAPQQDTATDIASACGISKALVARSVDGLHRRGFLKGERDENDRRLIHLHLCGEGGCSQSSSSRRAEAWHDSCKKASAMKNYRLCIPLCAKCSAIWMGCWNIWKDR